VPINDGGKAVVAFGGDHGEARPVFAGGGFDDVTARAQVPALFRVEDHLVGHPNLGGPGRVAQLELQQQSAVRTGADQFEQWSAADQVGDAVDDGGTDSSLVMIS
jgi:hypothetical protein